MSINKLCKSVLLQDLPKRYGFFLINFLNLNFIPPSFNKLH